MSLQIQVAPKADAEKASPEKKTIPQGAEAPTDLAALTARLNRGRPNESTFCGPSRKVSFPQPVKPCPPNRVFRSLLESH
jgi:hypothetical protein